MGGRESPRRSLGPSRSQGLPGSRPPSASAGTAEPVGTSWSRGRSRSLQPIPVANRCGSEDGKLVRGGGARTAGAARTPSNSLSGAGRRETRGSAHSLCLSDYIYVGLPLSAPSGPHATASLPTEPQLLSSLPESDLPALAPPAAEPSLETLGSTDRLNTGRDVPPGHRPRAPSVIRLGCDGLASSPCRPPFRALERATDRGVIPPSDQSRVRSRSQRNPAGLSLSRHRARGRATRRACGVYGDRPRRRRPSPLTCRCSRALVRARRAARAGAPPRSGPSPRPYARTPS